MRPPMKRKYRLDSDSKKPPVRVRKPVAWMRILKIPGLLIGTGLITLLIMWVFSGKETHAKPTAPEAGKYSFAPTCRWDGKIKKDESLYITLTDAGFGPRVVYDINCSLENVFNPRKILPGDRVAVDCDSCGGLVKFELERSPWEKYRVEKNGDGFHTYVDTIPLTYVLKASKGSVESTLWESMAARNVPAEAIVKFAEILSYDVDFITDVRAGQRYAIMYEEYYFNGELIDVGRVMAAHYWIADTNYGGIYYMDPDSNKGYYNLAGKNTKKALLKTPLTYRRISSYFTHSRFHPILKIYRPHLGVDYAAPTGTPVSASGAGKVVYCGWKGGYGNFIEIAHAGGIRTMYGHLSRFAKGIRKGVHVSQGQLIAYVGSTGLSTGPHLDYRVKVNGKYVNPLKYAFPDGPPVKKEYRDDFTSTAKSYMELLDLLNPVEEYVISEKNEN